MLIHFRQHAENSYKNEKKWAFIALSIFIFISPFPHTQFLSEVSFYLAILIFIYMSIKLGIQFEKCEIWTALLLFGGWCILSLPFALDPRNSFADIYSHYLKYLFFTVMLVNFFASRQGIINLARIWVASGVVFSMVIMNYFYLVLNNDIAIPMGLARWPTNTMSFVQLFSLSLIFPLFEGAKKSIARYLLVGAAIVLVVAMLLTQSRGTAIAVILLIMIFSFRMNKYFSMFSLVAVLTVIVISPIGNQIMEGDAPRKALSLYSFEVIKDHPIFGIGYSQDSFRDPSQIDPAKYSSRIPPKYRNIVEFHWPHNIFLDIAVRTGMVGLMFFVLFLWRAVQLNIYSGRYFVSDQFLCNTSYSLSAAISIFIFRGLFEPAGAHFILTVFYSILSMIIILNRMTSRQSICYSKQKVYSV